MPSKRVLPPITNAFGANARNRPRRPNWPRSEDLTQRSAGPLATPSDDPARASDHRAAACWSGLCVSVVDASEQVRLECHWHGGNRTTHTLVRPVARLKALSTYAALVARATDLHRAGNGCTQIAAILNQEGLAPAQAARHLQRPNGAPPSYQQPASSSPSAPRPGDSLSDSRMNGRSANWPTELGVPQPTVYNWVQNGRLAAARSKSAAVREVGHGRRRHHRQPEDDRATPPPWRRLPPPRSHPIPSILEFLRVAMTGRYQSSCADDTRPRRKDAASCVSDCWE